MLGFLLFLWQGENEVRLVIDYSLVILCCILLIFEMTIVDIKCILDLGFHSYMCHHFVSSLQQSKRPFSHFCFRHMEKIEVRL